MTATHADDARLLRDYIAQCSNWGRWGDHDQLGALNLVGPEEVRRAAGLVRKGKADLADTAL